jgi:hypothetical protein
MVDQLSTRSAPHLAPNLLKPPYSSGLNLRSRRNTTQEDDRRNCNNNNNNDDDNDDEILLDDDEETGVHRPLLPKKSVIDKSSPTSLDGKDDFLTSTIVETDSLISTQHRIPRRNKRRSYAIIYEPRYTPIDLFSGTMNEYTGHYRRRNDRSSPVTIPSSTSATVPTLTPTARNRSIKSKYKGRKRRINIRYTVFQPLPGELESWQVNSHNHY